MADSDVRACAPAALLVPADGWIGTLPSDQCWGTQVAIGCNRLRCTACGQAVVQRTGCRIRGDVEPAQLAARDPAQWGDVAGVKIASSSARVYTCACRTLAIQIATPVDSDRSDYEYNPIPWICTGHPPLQLPVALPCGAPAAGGAILTGPADAPASAAFLLGPGAAASTPPEMERNLAFGVERLVRGLWAHVDTAEALSRAVAGLVDAGDARTAARALTFFAQSPDFPGHARILDLLRERPGVFQVADPFEREARGLMTLAARVLVRRVLWPAEKGKAFEPADLHLCRSLAVAVPDAAPTLIYALFDHDRAWLSEHLDVLLAANPDLAGTVLYLWGQRERDALPDLARRVVAIAAVRAQEGYTQMLRDHLPASLAAELARQPSEAPVRSP